jgi:hypothetical protein
MTAGGSPTSRLTVDLKLCSLGSVHSLSNEAKDSNRAQEEDSIVELRRLWCQFIPASQQDAPRLTALLETSLSSLSVLASINRRRKLGKLACIVSAAVPQYVA